MMVASEVLPNTGADAAGAASHRHQRRSPQSVTGAGLLRAALLAGACSWLPVSDAGAQPAPPVPPVATTPGATVAAEPPSPADAGERRLRLFTADALLRGGQATLRLPVHLPPGRRDRAARLTLTYANALAVEPDGSALLMGANGKPLAELPLVAAQGAVTVQIDLPAGTLAPGVNVLTFAARQRHRFACDREGFGELWTRLDPERSYLELDADGAGPPAVADIDTLLAASLYDGEPFSVLTVRQPGDDMVPHWGGLVAEGYALRRGDRTARIEHGVLNRPGALDGRERDWQRLAGRNYAVVGTFHELAGLLPASRMPEPAGEGVMAVLPLPADPDHVAVLLTGPNEAAVTRAAEAFRTAGAPPVRAAVAAIGARAPGFPLRAAEAAGTAPPVVIEGAKSVRLADLGHTTGGQLVSSTEEIRLPLNLPPTFYGGDGQKLRLELNFAYGAGLAPTSALIINVNGAPWNMVRLDRQGGAIVDGAEIDLPLGLLRPGANTIGFKAVLEPEGPQTCAAMADRPMFSLFDDSRIHVPDFAHLARQPDLALFATTGYPYSAAPADQVEMVLAEANAPTLAAAWTLRAKLAQQHGAPLPGFRTGYTPGTQGRHLLVVGARDGLPPVLRSALPVGLAAHDASPAVTGVRPVAAVRDGSDDAGQRLRTDRVRQDWAERLEASGRVEDGVFDTVSGWLVGIARAVPKPREVNSALFPDLGALGTTDRPGTIVAFRSPFAEDRTVTLVTAANARTLQRAVESLTTPAVWRQLDGDVVGWGEPSVPVLSRRTAEPYLIEPVDTSPGHLLLLGQTFMARQPGYWLVLVFGLIGLASLLTRTVLRRMTA